MGFKPDWGGFFKGGLEGIEAMLLEDVKHKKKMKEMQDEYKLTEEEEERKRRAAFVETGMGFIENLITSGKFNTETNQAIYQGGLEMGLPLPILPGMGQAPAPMGIPTAGVTMPGGVAGMEGIGAMPREEVAGYGALFEAPAVEPEERQYGFTKKEFEEKEEFKAKPKKEKEQYARDMNLINNYYSTEGDKFIMPYDIAKMIETQVREAAMRQFKKFTPRQKTSTPRTFLGISLGAKKEEKLGTMEIRKTKEEWDKIYRNR